MYRHVPVRIHASEIKRFWVPSTRIGSALFDEGGTAQHPTPDPVGIQAPSWTTFGLSNLPPPSKKQYASPGLTARRWRDDAYSQMNGSVERTSRGAS